MVPTYRYVPYLPGSDFLFLSGTGSLELLGKFCDIIAEFSTTVKTFCVADLNPNVGYFANPDPNPLMIGTYLRTHGDPNP